MKKIFITTAIDYTNDVVHVGHAYQKIIADCVARFYRLTIGKENVFSLTGTDEHGGNIEESAQKQGKEPKDFVSAIAEQDKKQWRALHISYDRFIQTTDEDHEKTVVDFWKKSLANDDIYKGTFRGMYCLGCESYKTASEISDGKCLLHPTKELQRVEEENYFFRWSKYQSFLTNFYKENIDFVIPKSRQHEMESFLKQGVEDIVISRSVDKVSWGIPVPDDPTQVIYVWFDALINYYTAGSKAGFWDNETKIIHIIGKDILRWHSLLWPAMLKSAGMRMPNKIYVHGFINLNSQKISKSLGNVIRPSALVEQFGADAVRYFFLKYGPVTNDVDISIARINSVYNSELANGLGNTISRVAKLCETSGFSFKKGDTLKIVPQIGESIKEFRFYDALSILLTAIDLINDSIDDKEPWNLKENELSQFLEIQIKRIRQTVLNLAPFMPETSEKILAQFSQEKIKSAKPYFPRI